MKLVLNLLAISAFLIGTAGVGLADCGVCGKGDGDILSTLHDMDGFETLHKALHEADLIETLQGDGPFTVFAPTDSAFENLPPGALKELLANKALLKRVLLFHVLSKKLDSDQVAKLHDAMTAGGRKLVIKKDGDALMIGDAKITKTDIQCKNGVIHVIDAVLLSE